MTMQRACGPVDPVSLDILEREVLFGRPLPDRERHIVDMCVRLLRSDEIDPEVA